MSSAIFVFAVFLGLTVLSGCTASYPEEKVATAIQEICFKEYKIENVEVKFAGKTVGVFLPLKKLFAMDVRQELLSGNISNLESLFEPEPEAMEQLENVLFTISRVLLSSDREIDFYVLQATDIESTGLQLVLMGYIPDVRRVRLWDISRTEYRKRVLHELKFNRSVLWEKPVRNLFSLAAQGQLDLESAGQFFMKPVTPETVSPLLYDFLVALDKKRNIQIDLQDVKSRAYKNNQSLVYVKFKESFDPAPGSSTDFLYSSGSTLEYIFIVEPSDKQFKIAQVIPFYYIDESKTLKKVTLPAELDLDRNLDVWPERFHLEEILVGDFLARQLNRRIQSMLLSDERIHHTIRHAQASFTFRSKPEEGAADQNPYFSLYFDFITKNMSKNRTLEEVIGDEDVLYLMDMILREFAALIRSYQFENFDHLELVWEPGGTAAVLKIEPTRLDRFRERKMDIAALLGNKPPIGF